MSNLGDVSYEEWLSRSRAAQRYEEWKERFKAGQIAATQTAARQPAIIWKKATNAFLDEEGVWIESDVAVPATRLRLPLYVMRKVATLIQMYELSKMVPTDQDEPNAPDQALPVPP